MKLLFLTLVFVATAVATSIARPDFPAQPPIGAKPGSCPKILPGFGGACANSCSQDQECFGDQKCCSNGCGYSCMSIMDVRPVPLMKPGTCPPNNSFQPCGFGQGTCENDGHCSGSQKCCSSGCGLNCVYPEPDALPPPPPPPPITSAEKGGYCPANNAFSVCSIGQQRNECQDDNQCYGIQKCCELGCGKSCRDPMSRPLSEVATVRPSWEQPPPPPPVQYEPYQKPGDCPNDSFGGCVYDPNKTCLNDNSCPGTQKCCASACGKECRYVGFGSPAPAPAPLSFRR